MVYLWAFLLGLLQVASFSLGTTGPASGLLQVLSLAGLFYLWAVSRRVVWVTFCFGWAWLGVGLYWLHFSMHDIGGLPAPLSGLAIFLLASYLTVFYVLAALVFQRFDSRAREFESVRTWCASFVIGLPCLWVLAELGRGYVFTGFPWLMGGYAHVDNPLTKGWFAIFGAYGVGFVASIFAAVMAWILVLLTNRRGDVSRSVGSLVIARAVVWPVFVVAALAVVGLVLQGVSWGQSATSLTVRLVQPNVSQSIKFDESVIVRNTELFLKVAASSDAPLTVFPETALPYPWTMAPQAPLAELSDELKKDAGAGNPRAVIMGSVGVDEVQRDADGQPTLYNSAMWLDANGDVFNPARYDKIHLLPFGEVVPFGFQWFVDAMNIPLGGYGRGDSMKPFLLQTSKGVVNVGVNICYENEFGEELIRAWDEGDAVAPNLIVNVTNLGWFGTTDVSTSQMQHLQMSRARALEMARPVIVATNTGLSANIDAAGEVVDLLPPEKAVIQDMSVQTMTGRTPFTYWGNLPLLAFVSFVFGLNIFLRHRYSGA
jgi:apolipoprotein N-acyltransferase